jgi:hypothetical protein
MVCLANLSCFWPICASFCLQFTLIVFFVLHMDFTLNSSIYHNLMLELSCIFNVKIKEHTLNLHSTTKSIMYKVFFRPWYCLTNLKACHENRYHKWNKGYVVVWITLLLKHVSVETWDLLNYDSNCCQFWYYSIYLMTNSIDGWIMGMFFFIDFLLWNVIYSWQVCNLCKLVEVNHCMDSKYWNLIIHGLHI